MIEANFAGSQDLDFKFFSSCSYRGLRGDSCFSSSSNSQACKEC